MDHRRRAAPRLARPGPALDPRFRALSPALVAVLVAAFIVAACGAGSSPSPAAASPAESFPSATFTGGPATASVLVGGEPAVRFAGGWCERPRGSAWLAVNVGDPNGSDYFGLVVGPHPYGGAAASPLASGGMFQDPTIIVSWRHAGRAASLERGSVLVQVDSDLRAGTFTGSLADGTKVTGEFGC